MTDQLGALTTIFTEFYYWVTVVLMFLIHVGFCMYEVGASRYKHHQHTLMKNTMLIPLVTVTWFLFGWWIYWAFPTGPGLAPSIMNESTALITDESAFSATWYTATSDLMAVNLGDHISGVFWAAFLLFSWTAASIVSGAIIERITTFAFGILAIAIGSVFWTIDAAWMALRRLDVETSRISRCLCIRRNSRNCGWICFRCSYGFRTCLLYTSPSPRDS